MRNKFSCKLPRWTLTIMHIYKMRRSTVSLTSYLRPHIADEPGRSSSSSTPLKSWKVTRRRCAEAPRRGRRTNVNSRARSALEFSRLADMHVLVANYVRGFGKWSCGCSRTSLWRVDNLYLLPGGGGVARKVSCLDGLWNSSVRRFRLRAVFVACSRASWGSSIARGII